LEWVTTASKKDLVRFFDEEEVQVTTESEDLLELVANDTIRIRFHITPEGSFYQKLLETTGSPEFLLAFKNKQEVPEEQNNTDEVDLFIKSGLPWIPPYLRESEKTLARAATIDFNDIIQTSDIKGLIHSHSNWSDGAYTIEQMAEELIRLGFEYLVISDHSKAAYYANGLSEQKILEQHRLIDRLNQQLAPFKIYKSIECDILNDGSMDYTNDVLSSFDLVIASVHSNLDMPEDKAMMRLLGAITNPYVTILGHMTGRLLLKRKGYPVDHKAIIDACAEHKVVIEINAHPVRLDIDWRWIEYALEKGVLLSINPDAHALDEFQNIKYGVLVAQKGGLTKHQNLSSFSRSEFEQFLQERKRVKNLI
jgi:DNA polymerase (family 10)